MPKAKDLTGQQFNHLVVIGVSKKKEHGCLCWYCQCTLCGNLTCVSGDKLRKSHTKSCGCLYKKNKNPNYSHGKYYSNIYRTWRAMIQRCYNSKTKNYHNYGGRGISVCEKWHKFENFYADMGERPEDKSIDRIDNDGNYEPKNCKWSTPQEQIHNQRAKGYWWNKNKKKWQADISVNGKKCFLGCFDTPEEARQKYLEAKEVYHGKID